MTIVKDIYDFATAINENLPYDRKILIEGDSWVSHPLPGARHLACQFDDFGSRDSLILSLASPGDEALQIFKSYGSQMAKLRELLCTKTKGDKFDLIFLSAGGNDIVGPEIIYNRYIENKNDFPYLHGTQLIRKEYTGMVDRIVNGYRLFLNLRDRSLNADTPVMAHSYCYLTPRKVGTHLGDIKFTDGWVAKYFIKQGIKDKDEQYEIVCKMVDIFHDEVKKLESEFTKFKLVDGRKLLLKGGKPNLELFFDEIHPNDKGFKKVAKYIRKVAIENSYW